MQYLLKYCLEFFDHFKNNFYYFFLWCTNERSIKINENKSHKEKNTIFKEN